MHLGKIGNFKVWGKFNGWIVVFINITQNGCLSGSVWSDNCHFLTSLHGEGHFLHDLPVECDTVIFHFQNHFFMILFRSFFTGGLIRICLS